MTSEQIVDALAFVAASFLVGAVAVASAVVSQELTYRVVGRFQARHVRGSGIVMLPADALLWAEAEL
jgi:hypothetical protein